MRPAIDLDDVARLVEMIVNGVCIGDDVAFVAREHVIDGVGVVLRRVLEEHMTLWCDEDPKVSRATFFGLLHEHAGRVDEDVRLSKRVLVHRRDQRPR